MTGDDLQVYFGDILVGSVRIKASDYFRRSEVHFHDGDDSLEAVPTSLVLPIKMRTVSIDRYRYEHAPLRDTRVPYYAEKEIETRRDAIIFRWPAIVIHESLTEHYERLFDMDIFDPVYTGEGDGFDRELREISDPRKSASDIRGLELEKLWVDERTKMPHTAPRHEWIKGYLDTHTAKVGDSLRRHTDDALREAMFGGTVTTLSAEEPEPFTTEKLKRAVASMADMIRPTELTSVKMRSEVYDAMRYGAGLGISPLKSGIIKRFVPT